MTLAELRRQLEALKAEMRTLSSKEGLTVEEFKTQSAALTEKRSAIDAKIALAEQIEADDQAAATAEGLRRERANRETEQQKVRKRYSIVRAVRMAATGQALDGVEKEMQEEADKEGRASGLAMEGNIRIPSMLIRNNHEEPERRATMLAGTANVGGSIIAT